MSVVNELIKKLREIANCYYGEIRNYVSTIEEAADTIQALSAKLPAANMERPTEDCGGWIPCKERLPKEKDGNVLICQSNGEVRTGSYSEYSRTWYKGEMRAVGGYEVIAWRSLPEPYHES